MSRESRPGSTKIQNVHDASRRSSRRGYTLLELLLALGLSVVVITVIGVAIQTYVIALTRQQATLEQKQVVRSITPDLRRWFRLCKPTSTQHFRLWSLNPKRVTTEETRKKRR